jgi:hypothetical protein
MNNYDNKETVEQLIGITNDGVFIFVDKFFKSSDKLYGATGTRMCAVSKERLEERIENVKDYDYSPLAHIYDEKDTPESWETWINSIPRRDLENAALDPSYRGRYWNTIEDICDKLNIDFHTTECIGGGRMFGDRLLNADNYSHLENSELIDKIKQAENDEYF